MYAHKFFSFGSIFLLFYIHPQNNASRASNFVAAAQYKKRRGKAFFAVPRRSAFI